MPQPVAKRRRSAPRRHGGPTASSSRLFRLAGAAIVAVAVVVAVIVWGRPDEPDRSEIDYATIPSQGTVLGAPDAPVRIVEYADYQCPFCGQFSQDVVPRIIDDFVRTGQASYELRIFPFLGGSDLERPDNESVQATEAAYCAMDQGKFWPFNDALFANQDGENDGGFSDDRLNGFSADLGLAGDTFAACLESNTHHQTALDSFAAARAAGITSTPTIVINGQPVTYTSRGYELLRRQIEAAIAGEPIPR